MKQLDITGAEMVQVEIDYTRRVLYVHVDGYTALRICRIKRILPTQSRSTKSVPLNPEQQTKQKGINQ
jgi:hypothetical protein